MGECMLGIEEKKGKGKLCNPIITSKIKEKVNKNKY